MEIVFFLILVLAMLFAAGYAVYSFFTAPRSTAIACSLENSPNEGQFFDGADGYDATGGYQASRD